MTTYSISVAHLKAINLFTSTEHELRYYLKGVHVEINQTGLRLTASDGYTMATYTSDQTVEEPVDIIIDNGTIDRAIKSLPKKTLTLRLDVNDTAALTDRKVYRLNDLPFEPIKGRYPNTRLVWPEKVDGQTAWFNPEYTGRIVKTAKLLGFKNPLEVIRIWHNSKGLVFQVEDIKGIIMPLRGGEESSHPEY